MTCEFISGHLKQGYSCTIGLLLDKAFFHKIPYNYIDMDFTFGYNSSTTGNEIEFYKTKQV